jgi:thiol-disulfide isomerase/thioredoxin
MNTIKLALTAFFTIAAAFGAQSETDETKIAVKDIRSIKYKNRTITLSPEKLKRQIERCGLIDHTGAATKGRLDAKYLLIYFSAHWCGGCRGFTPKLAEFYRKYHDKYDFEIVFCSSDHSQEQMLEYIREFKMPWPCLARQKGNFYIKIYGARSFIPNGTFHMGIPKLMVMNMANGKCYGVPLFGEAENLRAKQTLKRFKKELGITDSKIQK